MIHPHAACYALQDRQLLSATRLNSQMTESTYNYGEQLTTLSDASVGAPTALKVPSAHSILLSLHAAHTSAMCVRQESRVDGSPLISP